jgi:hypothetical protein
MEHGTNLFLTDTWMDNIESLSTKLAGTNVEEAILEEDQDCVLVGDIFDTIFKSNDDVGLDNQLEPVDESDLNRNNTTSDCKTIALSNVFIAGQLKLTVKDPRKSRKIRAIVDKRTKVFYDSIYYAVKDREDNLNILVNDINMLKTMLDDNTHLSHTEGMNWFNQI